MIKPLLADKKKCTGCSACVSVCPTDSLHMGQDEYGFFIPVFADPQKCIECQQCYKVCPIENDLIEIKTINTFSYAAYSNSEYIRKDSSSGGVFSEIALDIINNGGIVYGAAFDDNWKVIHIAIDNIEDLWKLRTAKYSQSDLGRTFLDIKEQLNGGKTVLFTGTPCQVVGLKSFLKCAYENLICMDFVCHSIPAPFIWEAYLKYRAVHDNHESLPVAINLRSKANGWSRYKYSVSFKYATGTEYQSLSETDPFMKLFTGDYISRESCSTCKYKGDYRWSDITIGDFWGIWDIDPSMDDNKGTSVVIIRSSAGNRLFESIKHRLCVKAVSLNDCSLQNPSLICASLPNKKREAVLKRIISNGFEDEIIVNSEKQHTITKALKRIKRKISRH